MNCLLNETYLYLLEHPDVPINATQLEAKIGKHRKTIGRQITALRQNHLITENDKIVDVYNISNFHTEEQNKYIRALLILRDSGLHFSSLEEASELLDVVPKTLRPFYNELVDNQKYKNINYNGPAVYQIVDVDSDTIIYIGYTTNFASRRNNHLSSLRNCSTKALLYEYCTQNNITNISITTIIEHEDVNMLKSLETYLIQTLQPVCNVDKKIAKIAKESEWNEIGDYIFIEGDGVASEAGLCPSSNITESQKYQVQLLGF